MDDYSGKRATDGLVSRKGSSLVLRDNANNRDQNAPFCSRIGCSGRLNSGRDSQIKFSEKAKSSRTVFRPSSSGKEVIGSSSKSYSVTNKPRKSFPESRKKLSSQVGMGSSESSSVLDEPNVAEYISPPRKIERSLPLDSGEAACSDTASTEVGSSSSSTRSRRFFRKKSGLDNPNNVVSPPLSLTSRNISQGIRTDASRYGLTNVRCSSPSDVVPSGSSSSESNLNRRKDMVKKRICDGENSSTTGGKKLSGPLSKGRKPSSSLGISISDSRQTRSGTHHRDSSAPSDRNRRSATHGHVRARTANIENEHNLPRDEYHAMIPQISQPDSPIDSNAPTSSHQYSVEDSLSYLSSYGPRGSGIESMHGIRPSTPAEVGNARSLVNRESFRRYNMDGIAEVLLALERIEHDEELTYEQLLVLEANVFLNGLNFHDQHRDMRLDIDNMSYEELLALEERMGTVKTALSEEEFSECVKTSIHQSPPLEDVAPDCGGNKDDGKCSICQEDYAAGDEMGRLRCEHQYHVACIQQWLGMKNWCPICKASVAPSSSSSSP